MRHYPFIFKYYPKLHEVHDEEELELQPKHDGSHNKQIELEDWGQYPKGQEFTQVLVI